MTALWDASPWEQPIEFLEEFRELSEQRTFASDLSAEDTVEVGNPVCGDRVWVWLKTEGEVIQGYGYRQQGCWPVVGCLELWGRLLPQLTVSTLLSLTLADMLQLVHHVPHSKRHAFSLTLRAVQMAAVRSRSFPPQ